MFELSACNILAFKADERVNPERNCDRARESPLLGGNAPAVR